MPIMGQQSTSFAQKHDKGDSITNSGPREVASFPAWPVRIRAITTRVGRCVGAG